MRTQQIEQASALIRTAGTPRDRELRAYYLARGRFADLLILATDVTARATVTPRLSLVA